MRSILSILISLLISLLKVDHVLHDSPKFTPFLPMGLEGDPLLFLSENCHHLLFDQPSIVKIA